MEFSPSKAGSTYINPVYPGSFPDPFVLKHGDEYFAFCTGFAPDGRVFGMLSSNDLVTWRELPGAMEPLPPGIATGEFYWAPEVTFYNGSYYLYYSVGNETYMEIRVATSGEPAGPYRDTGHKMTSQDFAIDPHVFIDEDASRYMFYATDFLDHSHVGTGTVIDRMLDPVTLAGDPRPVTRAKYDWQVYDPARTEKGGVRWHTVEGPFVLKRKGLYFEMFSGGNWQNITYGVGYAVSDSLDSTDEWVQQIDGTDTLPLLRTIPDKVIGPGHNSVVSGPNGRELFCVYHRWQDNKRVMCIDRMDFAGGDRLFVYGPSYDPQRRPLAPVEGGFDESFDDAQLSSRGWSVIGKARVENRELVIPAEGRTTHLTKEVQTGKYDLALNFRIDNITADEALIVLGIDPLIVRVACGPRLLEANGQSFELTGYRAGQFHQLRIVNEGRKAALFLDGIEIGSVGASGASGSLELAVSEAQVTFDMVRYTPL